VKANYYFQNAGNTDIIDQVLFYPFPINEHTPFPNSIVVLNPINQIVDYSQVSNGVYFKVSIPSGRTVGYEVRYIQKLKINKFEYILTSTQNWGKPLSSAMFNIFVDSSITVTSISYTPNSTVLLDGNVVYRLYQEDFFPTKNLIIEW